MLDYRTLPLFASLLERADLHPLLAKLAGANGSDHLHLEVGTGPATLFEALRQVDDLGSEEGLDALLAAGVPGAGSTLDPQAFAARAAVETPAAFAQALDRLADLRIRRLRAFPGRTPGMPPVPSAEAEAELADRLGRAFFDRERTRHCRLERVSENRTLSYYVHHGRALRVDEILHPDPDAPTGHREDRLPVRPRQRDLVVYEPRSGHLRVQARDALTVRLYRAGFGELLYGDPTWFGLGAVVSLSPLLELGESALLPTPGISHVELESLELSAPDGGRDVRVVYAAGAFAAMARWGCARILDSDPVRARLNVFLPGRTRPRAVTLAIPNEVTWDHRHAGEDEVTRTFLETRGFLSGPTAA